MKRIAVYCRVSTDKEIQENSFDLQKQYYTEKIAANPSLRLAGIYGDLGKTGTSIRRRPEFRRMMDDCLSGKIDEIWTKSISRFSRNLADCMEALRTLKRQSIPVVFEKENLNSMDKSGELFLGILAAIAQEESHSISLNTRWTISRLHSEGIPTGKVPFGYRCIRREWVIDEEQARFVRYAFAAAAKGMRYRQILKGLNAMESARCSQYRWKNNTRLNYMLRNIAYTGNVLTDKTFTNYAGSRGQFKNCGEREQFFIEEHHEPLVDQALFDRVQLLMDWRLLDSRRAHYTPDELAILNDKTWMKGEER